MTKKIMRREKRRMTGEAEHRSVNAFGKLGLQIAVAALACIPVLVGAIGVVGGPAFLNAVAPWPLALDSHFRFLSGVFLAVGVAWWSTIPEIERKQERFRLLGLLIVSGGLARLVSLFVTGWPPAGHVAGLAMELIVVPLLVLWHAAIVRTTPALVQGHA
jgi:Domain of unknown function (DUF4345)